MNYHIIVYSHVGNSRAMQEDNYLAGYQAMLTPSLRDAMPISQSSHCTELVLPVEDNCFFVCDGMGGHAHGEIASLTAVQLLREHYSDLLQAASVSTEAIKDLISEINDEFCRTAAASPDLHTMGTTLCGVIAKEDRLYGLNIGDSRLYMHCEGALKQISIDHTEGQRLLNLGLMTEEEVALFPNRKAIYKYLGKRIKLRPDIFDICPVSPGTVLLLTTDGLTDALTEDEISAVLQAEKTDLKKCGSSLIEKAISRNIGFGDNITLILIAL